jgi:hypothetical protein
LITISPSPSIDFQQSMRQQYGEAERRNLGLKWIKYSEGSRKPPEQELVQVQQGKKGFLVNGKINHFTNGSISMRC